MSDDSHAKAYIDKMTQVVEKMNRIDPNLYEQFNVKRGLRNSDGTGVLVGLTEIGEVHGYIIDEGEKVAVPGKLYYRGYDLEDLAQGLEAEKRFGFEETAYLLLFGELPTKTQLDEFSQTLGSMRELPDGFAEDMILKAPSPNIMNKLARAVLASYSYDKNPEDMGIKNVLRQSIELIARFPTMVAYGFQAKKHYYDRESLFIHSPKPGLSTSENFLSMIRPDQSYSRLEAEILDLCFVLHAEHGGGNNSTFTIHVVSSSDTDTYSAIAAGVGSLKGFKHGGANYKVMDMVENIKANVKNWGNEGEVADYIKKILNKEAFDKTGLIYGMGHAVYTVSDPRAVLLSVKAERLAKDKGMDDELDLYRKIERLGPELFKQVKGIDKGIAINVDFYSGFVYKMLNIPTELFTPMFAISRISGWCAHRLEEIISGGRIIRPAYKQVQPRRDYIGIQNR